MKEKVMLEYLYRCQELCHEDWSNSGWRTFFETYSHRKAKNAIWLAQRNADADWIDSEFRIVKEKI